MSSTGPLRVGIGGPVGVGKTTLTEKLCKAMRDRYSVAVVTNDIFTKEDALILNRAQALPTHLGVETAMPSLAIREMLGQSRGHRGDAAAFPRSRHRSSVRRRQSRGDVFAGSCRHHSLRHRRGRRQIPAGGPGITRSDLLIINKIDRALCQRQSRYQESDTLKQRGQSFRLHGHAGART